MGAFFVSMLLAQWPDLSTVTDGVMPRAKDAAVIVGIEHYATVAPVGGAVANANDWYTYLSKTLQVPASQITLLRDNEGTLEKLRKYAAQAATQVQRGGTLWFIFIGHGAPRSDGKDGLLVGFDAQAEADSIAARSLPQSELLSLLKRGAQDQTVVLLDACFSGKTSTGAELVKGLQPLVPMVGGSQAEDRTVVISAAKSDQFAGPLPGLDRPAFSYLALGALRGWADKNKDRVVTANETREYIDDVLRTLVKDRAQNPGLQATNQEAALASGASEAGPDLSTIVLRTPSRSELQFSGGGVLSVPAIKVVNNAEGLRGVDLKIEQQLDSALDAEESKDSSPAQRAAAWCLLAQTKSNNPYLATAEQGCAAWSKYDAEQRRQTALVDGDYKTLAGYLRLRHKSKDQKLAAVDAFLSAYAGIDKNAKVALVSSVRKRVRDEGKAELPSGAAFSVEIVNELGEDYVLRTGRTLLNGQQVHQFLQPPPDRKIAFTLNEQPPGRYDLSFSLSMVSFETVGVIMSCTQPIGLSEMRPTALKLRLVKDTAPRLQVANPDALGSARPANDQLPCTIEVLGGNYTKRNGTNTSTNTGTRTKRK